MTSAPSLIVPESRPGIKDKKGCLDTRVCSPATMGAYGRNTGVRGIHTA